MRFSVGAAPKLLTAAAVVATALAAGVLMAAADHRRAEATASKKPAKPFSVWFRAEPDLPRKKDMKAKKLNRLIGSDYDEMWMSKTPMLTAAAVNGNTTTGWDKPVTPDALLFPEQLPAQYHEMLRSWLARRSTCPVEFVWTDLGKSFWPRWIKQGRCGRTATMSCSWPPGMSCMPSSVRVLALLRWHCWLKNRRNKRKHRERKSIKSTTNKTTESVRERGGASLGKKKKNNKFRCLWIKVPFPVTEDCTCSCRKLDN